jgi:hypothetical protein
MRAFLYNRASAGDFTLEIGTHIHAIASRDDSSSLLVVYGGGFCSKVNATNKLAPQTKTPNI